jgi:hypothetical protein
MKKEKAYSDENNQSFLPDLSPPKRRNPNQYKMRASISMPELPTLREV